MTRREVQVTYRAQARCGCGWKGERRVDTKREPSGSLAYAEAQAHGKETGHADARVEAGWSGACRSCNVRSDRYQRSQDARAWADDHVTSDPKHLRRQRERDDLAETADQILGAIKF